MAISKRDQQELDKIYTELKPKYGGMKEDYFPILYLVKKFKVNPEDIIHQVAFGNNDYGIDSYYIDRESRNLYLYQFKWSENHNLFKQSLERLAKDGMERIFGDPQQDPDQNELIRHLKSELYEHQALIDRIYIQFVFKGDAEAADNSSGLSDRRENLENKKWLVDKYFSPRQVDFIFSFISDKPTPPPRQIPDSHTIAFSEKASIQTHDGDKKLYVGFISLWDLYKIYQSLGNKFFNRNIRAGLSVDNPPNRKIRKALESIVLKKQEDPIVFVFNHNGITIAVEHIDFQDGQARIKVPRLLNGAQTVISIAKFVEDNESNPLFKENMGCLESIKVLAKIVAHDPWSDFITNVTICNNQQNPVHPWNLRANDRIQCDLQDKFREEVGIFYSRQENAFQNLSDSELQELGIQDSRDIKIKLLAQTFLAIQGEIDRMSRLPEVFEDDKHYGNTFRESYIRADTQKIVLAYKTLLVLNSPMKKLNEKLPRKIAYAVAKARNLVYALLIQGMLNDPKLPTLLEWYGNSLAKETDFREYLQKLASSKLLPILKEVLSDISYADKIKKEKYDFLRTKEVYRRCMETANKKYKWAPKSI
ncbi:MAG TPA: AIPR family protein [Ignavibacteria bacterium]